VIPGIRLQISEGASEGRLEEGQTAVGDVGPPWAEAATWPARAIRSLSAGSVSS
jgi:hypothetical protein